MLFLLSTVITEEAVNALQTDPNAALGTDPWHVGGNSNGRVSGQSWNSYEYFDGYFSMRSVKSSFIAITSLWLLWTLLRVANGAFSRHSRVEDSPGMAAAPGTSGAAAPANTTTGRHHRGTDYVSHLGRAAKLAGQLVLWALVPAVINALGRGSGKGGEILLWIVVSISAIYVLVELFMDNRLVRAAFESILLVCGITLVVLTYSAGWHLP